MGLFDELGIALPTYPKWRKKQFARPEFTRPDGWKPCEHLPELTGLVALDLENKDIGLAEGKGTGWFRPDGGFITGIGFGNDQLGTSYLPIGHLEGSVDPDRVLRWLKVQAQKPDVTFIFANAPYDLGWMRRVGITPKNLPHDVQIMAALANEHRRVYSLDSLGREFLGEGKNEVAFKEACLRGGLLRPFEQMDLVPAWLAEEYNAQDIHLTDALFPILHKQLVEQDLLEIYELERECALVAVDMKEIGVAIDNDKVERTRREFVAHREEYIALVKRDTGINISLSDPKSIIAALKAENPDLELPRTAQGKESIRADVIDELPSSPIVTAIQWGRKYDRAIGTFIDAYLIGHQHNGRIHADFHPTRRADERTSGGGTTSGRFASSNPNLQNIPIRIPEIGIPLRACFVPDDGQWAKLDYASQEPRLTIHYAALMELRGAAAMVERFRRDPLTDLHLETALLMFGFTHETWGRLDKAEKKRLRGRAKVINLAIAYGAGGANIARQLGLPAVRKTIMRNGEPVTIIVAGDVAQTLLDKHARAVPFMKELQKIATARVQAKGIIRTILGRVAHFEKYGDEYGRAYKGLNALIQGSAADQMKMALVLLRREGIRVQLTVHDEADMSVPRGADQFIARIRQIMEEAVPLLIPVVAEVKLGGNWGEVSVD